MNRTGALAVASLGLLGLGVVARSRWPDSAPALDCEPGAVRVVDGIAVCGDGAAPSAPQRLVLGQKLDLNSVSEDDLARVPGIGPSLARRLIRAREDQGRFASWAEVAAVPGVGAARLETLQATTELR
ncbi:helix-hairpin-helix domain-containing protein [Archangium violaceum]|uniref:ComEA family DNA-binding protein n=1 Tax=Archangium violaceum TaxID=83451 RepID=UPI00193B3F69|nr:helix-hairpin-helix domain-containing protein [Archangium violaceum]QRK05956.1 helix-hairpin-helix domain-containing protein [Archangium violaceum]